MWKQWRVRRLWIVGRRTSSGPRKLPIEAPPRSTFWPRPQPRPTFPSSCWNALRKLIQMTFRGETHIVKGNNIATWPLTLTWVDPSPWVWSPAYTLLRTYSSDAATSRDICGGNLIHHVKFLILRKWFGWPYVAQFIHRNMPLNLHS